LVALDGIHWDCWLRNYDDEDGISENEEIGRSYQQIHGTAIRRQCLRRLCKGDHVRSDDMKRLIASNMLKKIETMPRVVSATAPILGQDDRTNKPKFLGSAVLVKINTWHFAFTAAHVLDNRSRTILYIGSGNEFVQLRGSYWKPPDTGNRNQDRIDIGLVHLSEETVQNMQEDEFLTLDDTYNLDSATTTGHYVFTGYPQSRHKSAIKGSEVEATPYSFVVLPASLADYQNAGLDPNISLLLRFDKQNLWNSSGQVVGPDPTGISGGGVWFLDNAFATTQLQPLLVAVAIQWWEKPREKKPSKRILATKLHVALSAIWSRFPELRSYTPAPTNAQQSNSPGN
jgi:hypothetical protein